MSETNWNPEAEEAFGLMAAELLKPAFDQVKATLPPGTDFGLLILVPGQPEGRVIAMTTDRKRVGVAAAQWILNSEPFTK